MLHSLRITILSGSLFSVLFLSACGQDLPRMPDDTSVEEYVPGLADDVDSENAAQEVDSSGSTDLSSTTPTPEKLPTVEGGSETDGSFDKYSYVDPTHLIPTDLLKRALTAYDSKKATLKNPNYLSVLNFGARSSTKRLFVIDMKTGSVWALHVAHGKGSDANHDGFAEKFSNQSGSNASSPGLYMVSETYNGKHGLSVKLDGLSKTNSNARPRSVVIHGADYVKDSAVIQGRSWGCPAISMTNRTKLINLIKGGSLLFADVSGKMLSN